MNLTFNTSEGRKELPVTLVGTLGVSIAYWKMERMLGYVSDLNGGRIGYDTFCYRTAKEVRLVMPAAKDSAIVVMHPLGYDGQSDTDNLNSSDSMYTVSFQVYEPVYYDAPTPTPTPVCEFDDTPMQAIARIKITLDNGEQHHFKIDTFNNSIGWLVTAMEALIVEQCECITGIKIGMHDGGLAHEWIRGSRRILYRNLLTSQDTYIAFPWNNNAILYAQMDIEIEETYWHTETDLYAFDRLKVCADGELIIYAGPLRFKKALGKPWYRIGTDGGASSVNMKFSKRLMDIVMDYAPERIGI